MWDLLFITLKKHYNYGRSNKTVFRQPRKLISDNCCSILVSYLATAIQLRRGRGDIAPTCS
jgi:hypothetical protein